MSYHGFKTKKEARKQDIAVIPSQSKRQNKTVSFYFASIILLCITIM